MECPVIALRCVFVVRLGRLEPEVHIAGNILCETNKGRTPAKLLLGRVSATFRLPSLPLFPFARTPGMAPIRCS